MSKLLPNLPIEDLTSENDYLEIIEKGDLIKTFLQTNTQEFSEIKMFTLYGEWGSGKSTLMKYLEKELKETFNTFFFEAWEFESDSNLPLSLMEYLLENSKSKSKKLFEEIEEVAGNLLEGFTKSITLKSPILNINGKELVAPFEKKELSFLQSKNKFKKDFIKWENLITKGKSSKYNIVFIDDLDRCEPENVLNLLSALKLFFTYGKKTIFFCGIDKKAVRVAVNNKYGDIVKSEEYLEKIFDISFVMPIANNKLKLYGQYFNNDLLYDYQGGKMNLSNIIEIFFSSLRFNNVRKIKKILNRYIIIKNFGFNIKEDNHLSQHFPKILRDDEICLFDLIFTLYFILLKEFYPKKLADIENDKLRSLNYKEAIKKNVQMNGQLYESDESDYKKYLANNSRSSSFISAQTILNKNNSVNGQIAISKLIVSFAPINVNSMHSSSLINVKSFLNHFNVIEKEIDYYFTYFILANLNYLLKQEVESTVGINQMLQLIKSLP